MGVCSSWLIKRSICIASLTILPSDESAAYDDDTSGVVETENDVDMRKEFAFAEFCSGVQYHGLGRCILDLLPKFVMYASVEGVDG
jgi:hypothetical protein